MKAPFGKCDTLSLNVKDHERIQANSPLSTTKCLFMKRGMDADIYVLHESGGDVMIDYVYLSYFHWYFLLVLKTLRTRLTPDLV